MRIPDFFIAGALKSGTTSMHNYLKQHPDIYMPEKTEIFHFADDLLEPDDQALDPEWYASLFEEAGEDQLVGEKSAIYLYSEKAVHNIKAANPNAKIIILLREPVDFMYSLHAQTFWGGHEDIEDFGEAMAAEAERREGGRPVETGLVRIKRLNWYRYVAQFDQQVQHFFDVMGRDQVHVIIFDDLKTDAPGVYRKTLEFLGVDPEFQPEFVVKNPGKTYRSEALRNFERNPPTWMAPEKSKLSRYVIRRVRKFNTKREDRDPMDPAMRKALKAEFRPVIDNLAQMLDRDLSKWYK